MFKKHLLPLALIATLGGSAFGQRNCGTTEYMQQQFAQDPGYEERLQQIETFTQNYIAHEAEYEGTRAVVTIPVVVHIVYNTASENISDAQVYNQIDVLNDDFRRLNSDAGETPSAFLDEAADCEINFCLASVDPAGAATTGITRTSTTKTSFGTDDQMKGATYGHTAWDRDKYLNIWVCDLGSGLLGYAQFPGGSASTDGVAIDYVYFGVGAAGSAPYDLGRTTTHEVGHWLNLYHIWGDDGNSCGGSDLVADTPNQADETYGCPGGTVRISCSNGPDGDMYQNYMDYTDDGCMNLFTNGQKSRIQALFSPGGSRVSITTSNGCSGGGGGSCDIPTGLSTTGISGTGATFNWSSVTGASSYNVRYKLTSSGTWTNTTSGTTSKTVSGLTSGSDYEWQVQTDCGGGSTSAYSSSATFSTTGGGGGGCSDAYEPNETSGAAKTVVVGTTTTGLISSSTDVDWLKFTTTSPNTKIKVTMSSLPADYDMRLYNQSVSQKKISQNGGTVDETMIWNTKSSGTRYIKIYGWDGAYDASDCYDLLVETSSSNFRTDGSEIIFDDYADNTIIGIYPNPATSTMSVDYFSYQEMDVDVVVTDLLGNVIANTKASVVNGENMIEMNVTDYASGIYIIQISNGKSRYNEKFVKQ